MALIDAGGRPVEVGTRGLFLDERDFVFAGDDRARDKAKTLGAHGFPRDWPDVYTESATLRSLVKKKGPCAAKRVSVVPVPNDEEWALLAGIVPRRLQSFANAEDVKEKVGLEVVQGWAIFDLLDDVTGAAFVAERYWWNALADGTWVDATPRPEHVKELLLVEAVAGAPKPHSALTQQQVALNEHLFQLRFPSASKEVKAPLKKAPAVTPCTDVAAPSVATTAESLHVIVKRAKLGLADAVNQALQHLEGNSKAGLEFVSADMCAAIVPFLTSKRHVQATVHLMSTLTGAALRGGLHDKASGSVLSVHGIEPLLEILSLPDFATVADAAASLANICFRSPQVQDKASGGATMRRLVSLLSIENATCAGEAARVLWQLQVNRKHVSELALKAGAGPPLIAMLASSKSDDAKLNAAGALMQLAMAPRGQDQLEQSNAVLTVCASLSPTHPLPLREQAAGALLNLIYRHRANCFKAHSEGDAINLLVALLKEESEMAQEYAAGAISNLLVGDNAIHGFDFADAERVKAALASGAFEALVHVLVSPVNGPSSSALPEVCNALGDLAQHLSEEHVLAIDDEVVEEMVSPLLRERDPGQLEALSCCMNMAHHRRVKSRLVEAGIVKPLVRLLENTDKTLRERAASTLANLMNDHTETARAVFSQSGTDVVKKLIVVLETDESSTIRRRASQALAMLVALELPRKAALKTNVTKVLPMVLEKDRSWETLLAILNMSPSVAKERRAWQKKMVANDVLPPVIQMLQLEDTPSVLRNVREVKIRRADADKMYASATLLSLTQGCSVACRQSVKAGAIQPLMELVKCSGGLLETREYSAGALGNLLKHGGSAVQPVIAQNSETIEMLFKLLTSCKDESLELLVFPLIALAEADAECLRAHIGQYSPMLSELRRSCHGALRDQLDDLLNSVQQDT